MYVNTCLVRILFRIFLNNRCFFALTFQLCLRKAVRKIQKIEEELKLNEARRLLVCADGVNILIKNIISLKDMTKFFYYFL